MDGRLELVACATDGEIRGFLPSNVEVSSKVFDMASEQESIREMTQKKQNMLLELKNYEENAKLSGSSGSGMQLVLFLFFTTAHSLSPIHETYIEYIYKLKGNFFFSKSKITFSIVKDFFDRWK